MRPVIKKFLPIGAKFLPIQSPISANQTAGMNQSSLLRKSFHDSTRRENLTKFEEWVSSHPNFLYGTMVLTKKPQPIPDQYKSFLTEALYRAIVMDMKYAQKLNWIIQNDESYDPNIYANLFIHAASKKINENVFRGLFTFTKNAVLDTIPSQSPDIKILAINILACATNVDISKKNYGDLVQSIINIIKVMQRENYKEIETYDIFASVLARGGDLSVKNLLQVKTLPTDKDLIAKQYCFSRGLAEAANMGLEKLIRLFTIIEEDLSKIKDEGKRMELMTNILSEAVAISSDVGRKNLANVIPDYLKDKEEQIKEGKSINLASALQNLLQARRPSTNPSPATLQILSTLEGNIRT